MLPHSAGFCTDRSQGLRLQCCGSLPVSAVTKNCLLCRTKQAARAALSLDVLLQPLLFGHPRLVHAAYHPPIASTILPTQSQDVTTIRSECPSHGGCACEMRGSGQRPKDLQCCERARARRLHGTCTKEAQ